MLTTLPDSEFRSFRGAVKRIVESQEEVATTRITADLLEQDLLENMLEASKPARLSRNVDYLLGTPFRYPPLRHGSRFGARFDRWVFYASLEAATCLQECAYYRFLFFHDMREPPPKPIATQHTLFSVRLRSEKSVDLREDRYVTLQAELQSVVSYSLTQRLGQHVRDQGGELLIFQSARGPGHNVAVFSERAFYGRPFDRQAWASQVSQERALFRGPDGVFQYPLNLFSDKQGELVRVTA
jgi:hypothetical protein